VRKYFLVLFVISLALAACAPEESSSSLLGSWKLTGYGPAEAPFPAVEGVEAGLSFNQDGTVSGTSGCNGLGGDYIVDGDKITFGEFVSTLMACDDPIMTQEEAAHQVMTGIAAFTIEGDTLTITKDDMVLVLTRSTGSTEEPATPTTLTGAWKLTSIGTGDVVSSALADVEAGLTFNEDGSVTGTSGCNDFGGKYVVEGDQITFSEVISTLKLCDTSIMEQEEAIQQVLTETAAYQIEGDTLTLTKNDRVLVLTRSG
jgi:heat shock protein HslJ